MEVQEEQWSGAGASLKSNNYLLLHSSSRPVVSKTVKLRYPVIGEN